MLRTTCAAIALLALSSSALISPALAAGCATSADVSALKTAAIQQELMVAAFQCHEADAYNRFVMSYRGELQSSDVALKAFFVRRGGEHGEAGYDTFKTKAANLSALEQARHGEAFCADAHALFAAALSNPGSLASFVDSRSGAVNIGGICVESRPVLAEVDAKPEKMRAVAAPQAHVRTAQTGPAEIGGVPAHNLPVIPYRRVAASRMAQGPGDLAGNEDLNDAQPADDEYSPPRRSYGPPPGWQPQGWRPSPAPSRWYSRDPYGR